MQCSTEVNDISGVVAAGAGPPQRSEKLGAPKAPSVLRGHQIPESSVHTKLRRNAQMRQKKVWEITPSQKTSGL